LRQGILDCLNSGLPGFSFSTEFFSDIIAELYWVISGVKQNAQLYVSDAVLNNVVVACETHSLYYSISSDVWIGKASAANPSYFNLSIQVSPADLFSSDHRLRQIFITRKKADLRAYNALDKSEDVKRGSLLGYPKCCIKLFTEYWRKACSDYEGDVTPFVIANSQRQREFKFQTNHLTGLFGIPLVPHFPCSFSCKPTIRQTEERLLRLRQRNRGLADAVVRLMNCPTLYSEKMGAAIITSWTMVGSDRLTVRSAYITESSNWDEILKDADFIEFDQYGGIALLKGKHRQLMDEETILVWS
jgi:hypothetical protein